MSGYLGLVEESSTSYAQLNPPKSSNDKLKIPKSLLIPLILLQKISRTTISLPTILSRLPYFRSKSCHVNKVFLPSIGTIFLVLLIPTFILSTLFPQATLVLNPNRFGFLALACIPPTFILSAKSSPIIWLTSKGWTAINFLHRWSGRAIVLLVFLHAYFWTMQSVQSNQLAQFLTAEKQLLGITAFSFLLLIGISSIKVVRNYSFSIFFILHYVGIIGFLVYVNEHTPYANPWATYVVGIIYGMDLVGRLSGFRIRYVEVEAREGGMVRIGMKGVTTGWK